MFLRFPSHSFLCSGNIVTGGNEVLPGIANTVFRKFTELHSNSLVVVRASLQEDGGGWGVRAFTMDVDLLNRNNMLCLAHLVLDKTACRRICMPEWWHNCPPPIAIAVSCFQQLCLELECTPHWPVWSTLVPSCWLLAPKSDLAGNYHPPAGLPGSWFGGVEWWWFGAGGEGGREVERWRLRRGGIGTRPPLSLSLSLSGSASVKTGHAVPDYPSGVRKNDRCPVPCRGFHWPGKQHVFAHNNWGLVHRSIYAFSKNQEQSAFKLGSLSSKKLATRFKVVL